MDRNVIFLYVVVMHQKHQLYLLGEGVDPLPKMSDPTDSHKQVQGVSFNPPVDRACNQLQVCICQISTRRVRVLGFDIRTGTMPQVGTSTCWKVASSAGVCIWEGIQVCLCVCV